MNLALIRDPSGVPQFDDPETIKLFWHAKKKNGQSMLTVPEKAALKAKHNLDDMGRVPGSDIAIKVDNPSVARDLWKHLTPKQKQDLKERWKELKNDGNL